MPPQDRRQNYNEASELGEAFSLSPFQGERECTTEVWCRTAGLPERDDVLDAGALTQQQIAVGFHRKTPSDQRARRFGPASCEYSQIANRPLEGGPVGIHRANGDLVLQHH